MVLRPAAPTTPHRSALPSPHRGRLLSDGSVQSPNRKLHASVGLGHRLQDAVRAPVAAVPLEEALCFPAYTPHDSPAYAPWVPPTVLESATVGVPVAAAADGNLGVPAFTALEISAETDVLMKEILLPCAGWGRGGRRTSWSSSHARAACSSR